MAEKEKHVPQYTRIAADVASRIASGEFAQSSKVPGRNTLSSEYSVSRETVRKALQQLADAEVVRVRDKGQTIVVSEEAANRYLEGLHLRQEQENLRRQLRTMFDNYSVLGQKILEITESLIASTSVPLPAEHALPFYEMTIPEGTDKAGRSIGELRFWQRTGATIVAIRRGQRTLLSPGPYAQLQAGDIIVYVGSSRSRKAVQQLFTSGRTESTLYHIQEQINSAVHMRELYAVADILGAKLGNISDFEAMTKGMTNHSYLFSCKGERYILRIPGEGTDNLIDRGQEAAVYRAIAGTGVCDDIVHLDPKSGLKVTRYLDGVRSCNPFDDADLERCMALLRRFHSIALRVEHDFDIFGNIEYYESLWEGEPSLHEHYDQTKAQIMGLREYVEKHRGQLCLTHIDAVPDNFLFYPCDGGECLQLTDWEYAGMQDPHVDIAMFCLYSLYDRGQVDHLIDIYFEGQCERATRLKIYCYIAICGLLWSNWSEYKRHLGVEFGEYGEHQYRYAKEYYEIVREELGLP